MSASSLLRLIRQKWLWLAPHGAIGVFALTMLILTGLLQMREQQTAQTALEADTQWAQRSIEARMLGHQAFLADLGRDLERRRLSQASFLTRVDGYLQDNPDLVAVLWVDARGRIEWVAPTTASAARVGELLPPARQKALKEAFTNGRFAYSEEYANAHLHHSMDLFRPVQQEGENIGALVAIHSLENLLNATLPSSFATKYSIALKDDQGHEIISNTSINQPGTPISGNIRLNLLDSRLGLHVVAYRDGGIWLPYVPALLILLLTAITASTLVLLRRNALRRAESEEQLRDAYAFRQAMSQSLLTSMRAIDMEGRITYVNNAFCRMVGWSEEELIGMMPPFPYWPPEDVEHLQESLQRSLAGEAPLGRSETRIVTRDGERLDVSVYVSPLVDATGKQLGWMVAMNDITEPKRIRDELRQAQERFITVVDGLDSAVHVADIITGEILFANRVFQNIFGFDTVGRISEVVTANLQPPAGALLHDPLTLSASELPCVLFDGEIRDLASERWYHLHDRAIRWVDGRPVRVRIATDITERKNLDDLNQQQKKRVEETSRLITMGEMASSLAHELNQPLSAIANYCAGCIKRLESGNFKLDDVLAALKKADEQAQRAGKIIRRMRDMVKKTDPHLHPVALAEIVEETVSLADIQARRTHTEITLDIPADLPKVVADRIMIEQVLLNLAKNAIEAMATVPAATRKLVIRAYPLDGRLIEIAVSDNGRGLADQELEKIFAPFFTTKQDGLGIGLAICRSIVEFHQGRLWAESRPEGGTVFKFTLPREN